MRILLATLIFLNLILPNASAVTGVPDVLHWEAAGFGGGGTYSMVVPDHFTANKVYAIPDVNSPYVSTNKGDLWNYLSQVGSANSGYTITQTAAFVQSENTATLMYALDAANGGLNKSTDGGQIWSKVASFANSKSYKNIALDEDDDNNVYVASFSNLNESTNGGVNWTSLGRPFDSRADAYTTSSACTNAGASWSTSLGRCVINIRFVYHDTVNNDLFLGSARWGMVKYDLATDTQEYVDLTGTNATYNEDFATYVDGSSVENLCVTAGHKVACTSDFTNWTYTSAVTSTSTHYLNKIGVKRKADTTLTFIVNRRTTSSEFQSAQSRSTDSGSTWASVSLSNNTTQNPTGAFTTGAPRLYSIASDPNDQNVWYMSSDWRIWRSDDAGATFAEEVTNAQNTVVHDVAVAPNGRIFQVAMDTGVQYSDDGGTTWVQGTPSIAKGQPYVTGATTDYGGHYWQIELDGTSEEWDAGTGKVYIAATMYGGHSTLYYTNWLIKSVDSGVTYTRSNSGLPTTDLYGDAIWGRGYARALGISADSSKLYIGMDGQDGSITGGLFLSEDEGETFTRMWPSTPNRVFNAIAVDPTDTTGETLMFGTFRYNMYRITKINAESAELTGSGQTRTGTLNRTNQALNPVFTSASGEIFSPVSVGSNTLSSNQGGTGTFSGSTGAYSLTFISTPSTTTVTYDYRAYVGDSNGPKDYIVDVAYDSQGTPYAMSQNSGTNIYKSVVTAFGDGSGQYGTWRLMKNFGSNGLPDGIAIDQQNDNRIAVSITEGSSPSNRRIYITPEADEHDQATWYDITGDFPVAGGCRALAFDYFQGTQGYLLCAANGGGIWKINLADSPASNPGRTCFGGCLED